MNSPADPRLVWLVSVLIAAVTIVYIANRSMNPHGFHGNLSPAMMLHSHS